MKVEERFYVASEETLKKLRDLHRRRDEQAYILGCAQLEAMKREAELITDFADKPHERNLRLGVLRFEYLTASKQCERLVKVSQTDEKHLGEQALRSLGLNPDKEELRIDIHSGMVLVLKAGNWEPRLRE